MTDRMIVAVTGADGFIGKSLMLRLRETARHDPRALVRGSSEAEWRDTIAAADAVVHLAGVNRPADPTDFSGNISATAQLVAAIAAAGRPLAVVHASSTKAADATPYGDSKRAAEDQLLALAERGLAQVAIYRLPNVFGKWCRPDYNSGVATFCHNIAHGLPIRVDDPAAPLSLLYVDDLIDRFIAHLDDGVTTGWYEAAPIRETTVGQVADAVRGFRADRDLNLIDDVGTGLTRALYATYVSYLEPADFSYPIDSHRDPRGAFSEMLKTRAAGQFSYFSALPGVTRGGHYHHTKTEKFLIVHGEALFRFRHLLTDARHELRTSSARPEIVETIPGWTHDVTNVGDETMVSLLWANEIFDRARPDTVMAPL